MAIKIGIINQKGGVGKTSTSIALTDAMTQIGYKTLLIDFDCQGNASLTFGTKNNELNIYDVMYNDVPVRDAIDRTNEMGDILPANNRFEEASNRLVVEKRGELKLKKIVKEIEDDYDIIIVDGGPKKDLTMDCILTAVDGVIIPMNADAYSIEGLSSMLKTIEDVQEDSNPSLRIYGVLLTKYDASDSLQLNVLSQFSELEEAGIPVFNTIIRNSKAIPRVQTFNTIAEPKTAAEKNLVNSKGSIFKYGQGNGPIDYSNLAKELLDIIGEGVEACEQ